MYKHDVGATLNKGTNRLNDKAIRAALAVERDREVQLADGGGLYLRVRRGRGSWVFYQMRNGVRRLHALGTYDTTPLRDARAKRAQLVYGVGLPPAANGAPGAIVFEAMVADWFASVKVMEKTSAGDVRALVDNYCGELKGRRIDTIEADDIVDVLNQPRIDGKGKVLWIGHESGSGENLRNLLERMFRKSGIPDSRNPARWEDNLDHKLPDGHTKKHRAAMPHADVPAFMAKLRAEDSLRSKFLQLLILTGLRFEEVHAARWDEFQLGGESPTWTVPATRMKGTKKQKADPNHAHTVPLAPQVVALVQSLPQTSEFLFPGKSATLLARSNIVERFLNKIAPDADAHGFRASMATFLQENGHLQDLVDRCLAHVVGSPVTNAYQRSLRVEQRRAPMAAWASYATEKANG
jgi:integrase